MNILDQFHSSHKLPGQIFDASQQCALRFGPDSRKSQIQALEDICRLLRCDTGPKRSTVVYHAHPALEGTRCGENKVTPVVVVAFFVLLIYFVLYIAPWNCSVVPAGILCPNGTAGR